MRNILRSASAAMNTIPSTSKRSHISYTVLGGAKHHRSTGPVSDVSVLLLNRRGRFYRAELLESIQPLGFREILCVERSGSGYDLEPLLHRFPSARFILLQSEATVGEIVNIGIEEARSSVVFVLWTDMSIGPGSITATWPWPTMKVPVP